MGEAVVEGMCAVNLENYLPFILRCQSEMNQQPLAGTRLFLYHMSAAVSTVVRNTRHAKVFIGEHLSMVHDHIMKTLVPISMFHFHNQYFYYFLLGKNDADL